jgi:glycine cleavage system regulatory protein
LAESLVLTLIGPDRPGLVEAVSKAILEHGANWLESRMSRLAGKFAGILLVDVPEGRVQALTEALHALKAEGLRVVVEDSGGEQPVGDTAILRLQLVGQDRPGIVRDISRALAQRGVNVEELSTGCSSAPMSAETLFSADLRLRVPAELRVDELRQALEALANDLMVDITLSEPGD